MLGSSQPIHSLRLSSSVLIGKVLLAACALASTTSSAEPPRFSQQVDATVTYKINLQIGMGKDAGKYPGTLTYQVKSATPELIQLTVTGDLQGKPSRMPSFFRSSGESSLPTLESVSCRAALIGITPRGEVEVSQRDEMMGLLLGTIGQLAIAPLPPADAKPINARAARGAENGADVPVTWDVSDTTNIARVSTPFGFSPSFASQAGIQNRKLSIATEKWKYVAHPVIRNRMKIDHQYELSAPESDPPMKMQGDGIAFFNLDDGFYEQLQINRVIYQVDDGVEVKVPISISLTRETKQERDAKIAAAKEAVLKRTRPFTDAERKQWIMDLAPGASEAKAHRAMSELNSRNARQDPEIAKALLQRADMTQGHLKSFFYSAAGRYDESIRQMTEDRSDYSRSLGTVKRTGNPVTSANRLAVGQVLAKARERIGGFEAVEVTEVHNNVEVSVKKVGGHGRPDRVNVSMLRYPPATVPQPSQTRTPRRNLRTAARRTINPRAVPAAEEKEAAEMPDRDANEAIRTWSDKTGKYKIKAAFLAIQEKVVRLRSADGKIIEVPLAALSDDDAKLAEQLQKEAETDANPFQVVSE
ncbi:SHD1 domain-containing protein [Rhodopirellula halodulae]|uniref:SHD1 domain-containing protein n=1 Tax=Rhodopirellula halodulae TaxID=2894198 RepID=UPI001E4B1B80|nr:SHD1 domain-containing protein [Rhodopirellula sp. JC737]MCC9655935.1 cytoskeleton assembly control protein SLA1 [Rhodopirellula sp. JC737]